MTSMQQMYDFGAARVLMSGGSGVLGRTLVRALLAHGAQVVILSRTPTQTVQHFVNDPGRERLTCLAADLAQPDSLTHAVAVALAGGPITHLVNGAGGNRPNATTGSQAFADIPLAAMHEVMDVNVFSAIQLSQAVVPHFAARGSGCVLNISSISTTRPLTRVVSYSVAKAGLDAYTRWLATHLAREYAPEIRVNALAPGFFLTEQNRFLLLEADQTTLTERGRQILSHTPMGRFGTPEDLVGAFLWLLSPAAAFVTGQIITVDGGFSAYSGV